MQNNFDIIIIGAGPGGYSGAIRASQLGMSVALVEKDDIGGTCLNRGCIPTKTLVHTANLYREIAHSDKLGIRIERASVDAAALYARKDEVVAQLRQGVETLLSANKVALFRGRGIITGQGSVEVHDNQGKLDLTAKNVLIATGGAPARPPIPGADLPNVITSDELLQGLDELPKRLTIIGGGVIGIEFATIFAAFGCAVTIIEAAERVLPVMDREISQNTSMILKKRGVDIHTSATVEKIEQAAGGLVCVFSTKGEVKSVEADMVLISTGRRANVAGLFADGLSVGFDRGIVVDSHFRTDMPGVYAIGDVISGGIQLAHAATAQACAAVQLMSGGEAEAYLAAIPSCVYTDPEIACVGLTEQQAKENNVAVKTGKFLMSANGKSLIEAAERGFIKLVFDAESEALLGAQLMCARATDIIGELATAVAHRLTARQLAAVIRPHPTFCEAVTEAAEDAFGRAIHIAPRKR